MLKEKLQALSKEALKARDRTTRSYLTNVLSKFTEGEKTSGFSGWTKESEEAVIRSYIKGLKKSIQTMSGSEVAEGYEKEVAYLEQFLPKMLSEEETRALATPYAEKANGRLGPFMGMVLKAHKGEVDPGVVRKIGQELGLS